MHVWWKGVVSWSRGCDWAISQMQLPSGAGRGCCGLGWRLKLEQPSGGQFCAGRLECCLSYKRFRIYFAFWPCHWWLRLYMSWLMSCLVLFSAKCCGGVIFFKLQVWSNIFKFPVPYSSKLFWVISYLFAVLYYDFTYSIYNCTKQPSL